MFLWICWALRSDEIISVLNLATCDSTLDTLRTCWASSAVATSTTTLGRAMVGCGSSKGFPLKFPAWCRAISASRRSLKALISGSARFCYFECIDGW